MFAIELPFKATDAILVILLFSMSPSYAQTTFQRTFGGASDDYGYSVQQTSDGGYVITGSTSSFGAGGRDVYVIKTNSVGDTLWTRTYGGASDDYGQSVQQTPDGGYIIAGCTMSFGAGSDDVYLIKTNSFGDTLWIKTYGGSNYDLGYSVQRTSDGGYVIAGITFSFGAGYGDVYLIKTNSVGDTLWTQSYGGAATDCGYSVQQTSDGGYVIAGKTYNSQSGFRYDVYLIKTNSSGKALWTRTYGGTSDDFGYSVRQTSDGGYVITGSTSSFGAGGDDMYLIKMNSLGDTLWTRTYGGASYDEAQSVQQTSDGGYIIVGYTYSFGGGGKDVYIVKTNSVGATLWTRTYGGYSEDYGYSVQQTSDSGYIIAGWSSSFGNIYYYHAHVYLIKTDGNGLITDVPVPKLRGIPRDFVLKQNYPNPFNPSTTINYELPAESWVSLKVYNLFGQEVATLAEGKQEAGYKTVEWNASRQVGIASGVYFYRLRAGSLTETKQLLLLK